MLVAIMGLSACEGQTTTDSGPGKPDGDGATDAAPVVDAGPVTPAAACETICKQAQGDCPPDCQAQCEKPSSDPCAGERLRFWACAATVGKAVCAGPGALYITTPELTAHECSTEGSALSSCACAQGGLLCDAG